MLQAPGAAGESLTRPQPGGCLVELGARWVCGHLGQGRSPGWGTPPHHRPFPPSTLHTPLSSTSSCHGGPQSQGHGSAFPCKTPFFLPPSDLLTKAGLPVHIKGSPSLGAPEGRCPSLSLHLRAVPPFRPLAKSFPRELPRFPFG